MSEKRPPIQIVRIGNIKACIWENQSTAGKKFYTTTLTRCYRDEHEKWHESSMFYPDDLPKIGLASRKAFEYIYMRVAERQQSAQGQNGTRESHKSEATPPQQENDSELGTGETNGTHVEKLASSRSGRKR